MESLLKSVLVLCTVGMCICQLGPDQDQCVFALTYNPLQQGNNIQDIQNTLQDLKRDVQSLMASHVRLIQANSNAGSNLNDPECPASEGFIQIQGGYCVRGFQTERTWDEASDICSSIGAQLVSINSARKLDVIRAFGYTNLETSCRHQWAYWISARKLRGQWTDTNTGQRQPFLSWASNQPDNDVEDGCIELWANENYNMIVASCDKKGHFLCEKP